MRYSDLLGKPWKEMHCGQVVIEGLRRMDMADAALYVPADQEAAARVVEALGDEGRHGRWTFVSDEAHQGKPGDLIVADGPDSGDDTYHVSLVISPGITLTSSRRHGVHCIKAERGQCVRGVYRWEPPS